MCHLHKDNFFSMRLYQSKKQLFCRQESHKHHLQHGEALSIAYQMLVLIIKELRKACSVRIATKGKEKLDSD